MVYSVVVMEVFPHARPAAVMATAARPAAFVNGFICSFLQPVRRSDGGFLLSNFQSDMLDYFVPDEDFVYYESEDDFSNKISYYLSHEKEREQIAANALGKMRDYHTFHHRVNEILDIIA